MDEKIKELAIEVCCQHQPPFDNIGMGQYTKSQYNKAIEDMMHKFAELIIRDVLSNVWGEVQYSTSQAIDYSTSQAIANEIDEKLKKYYGVE